MHTIDDQTADECPPKSKASHNPSTQRQRKQEVGSEVGSLKTTSSRGRDVKRNLKLGIERVEQTVREPPEEEEDGDESTRQKTLPCSESTRTRESLVISSLHGARGGDDINVCRPAVSLS